MTTLIAWYGADSKKNGFVPASLYFASDSRISWESLARPHPSWDFAKKVFASRATPDIFGFAGGAEAGVVLLSQIVSLADHGLLFTDAESPQRRFGKFAFAVKRTWKEYPAAKRQPLEFLHGFRIGEGNAARFYVGVMRWGKSSTASGAQLCDATGAECATKFQSSCKHGRVTAFTPARIRLLHTAPCGRNGHCKDERVHRPYRSAVGTKRATHT